MCAVFGNLAPPDRCGGMMNVHQGFVLAALWLSVAACAREPAEGSNKAGALADAGASPVAQDEVETAGSFARSSTKLRVLTEAEVREADLPPELSCVFSTEAGPLLSAAGYVALDDPAIGLVKVGSNVVRVTAQGAGFDAMRTRGEFALKNLSLDVEPQGEDLSPLEDSRHRARLFARADGVENVYFGQWNCGP